MKCITNRDAGVSPGGGAVASASRTPTRTDECAGGRPPERRYPGHPSGNPGESCRAATRPSGHASPPSGWLDVCPAILGIGGEDVQRPQTGRPLSRAGYKSKTRQLMPGRQARFPGPGGRRVASPPLFWERRPPPLHDHDQPEALEDFGRSLAPLRSRM